LIVGAWDSETWTGEQIIQAIAIDIACAGDWVATTIIRHLAINHKASCRVVWISNSA
jgi:hypothetical protein